MKQRHVPAPSICAASIMSPGRETMYWRSRKMENGAMVIGRMTAQTVSSRPICRSVSTLGTIVT